MPNKIKGVGILLVVFAHTVPGWWVKYIYAFHMPLFFILAGEFGGGNRALFSYLFGKIKRLIVPFFSSIFFVFVFTFVFSSGAGWSDKFLDLYGEPSFGGVFSAYWFVPVFFVVQQLANLARYFGLGSRVVFVVAVFFASSFFVFFKPVFYLSGFVSKIFVFLLFYVFGMNKTRFGGFSLLLVGFAVLVAFFCVSVFESLLFDASANKFGLPVVSFFVAVAAFFLVEKFCSALNGILGEWLACLGSASMFIMYFHQMVHLAIKNTNPGVANFLLFFCSVAFPFIVWRGILFLSGKGLVLRGVFLGFLEKFSK